MNATITTQKAPAARKADTTKNDKVRFQPYLSERLVTEATKLAAKQGLSFSEFMERIIMSRLPV